MSIGFAIFGYLANKDRVLRYKMQEISVKKGTKKIGARKPSDYVQQASKRAGRTTDERSRRCVCGWGLNIGYSYQNFPENRTLFRRQWITGRHFGDFSYCLRQ